MLKIKFTFIVICLLIIPISVFANTKSFELNIVNGTRNPFTYKIIEIIDVQAFQQKTKDIEKNSLPVLTDSPQLAQTYKTGQMHEHQYLQVPNVNKPINLYIEISDDQNNSKWVLISINKDIKSAIVLWESKGITIHFVSE